MQAPAPWEGVGYVSYDELLDYELRATMKVEFKSRGPEVLGYSVVLLIGEGETRETVRLYDTSHRINEMHRYAQGDSKQPGVLFHRGTLGEGMRMAIESVTANFQAMIEGWEGNE